MAITAANLTLASSTSIMQAGAQATIGSSKAAFDGASLTSTIVNAGTLSAAEAGGTLTLSGT